MCRTKRQDDVFTYEVVQTLMPAPQIEEQMRGVIAAFQNNNFWLDLQSVDVCFRHTDKIIPSSERFDITLLFSLIVETIEMLGVGIFVSLIRYDIKMLKQNVQRSIGTSSNWFYDLDLGHIFCVLISYIIWSRNVSFLYFLVWRHWQMIKTYYYQKMEESSKNPVDMIQTVILVEKCTLRDVVTCLKSTKTKIHITDPCTLNWSSSNRSVQRRLLQNAFLTNDRWQERQLIWYYWTTVH